MELSSSGVRGVMCRRVVVSVVVVVLIAALLVGVVWQSKQ